MIMHQLHEIVKQRANRDQKFCYRYDYYINGLMSCQQDLCLDWTGMN